MHESSISFCQKDYLSDQLTRRSDENNEAISSLLSQLKERDNEIKTLNWKLEQLERVWEPML